MRQLKFHVLVALALLGSSPAWALFSLKFGIYASEKPTLLVQQFRPLLNYLEQSIGRDMGEPVVIELDVSPNYDEGIKALADGRVDFARMGPASFLQARAMASGIELLALENEEGGKYFQGVIFARADSGLHRLADLKGKRFAFGDHNSTAGRYLAQYALQRAGVRATDLAGYEYLGRHDRVAEAVWNGDFAAGAVKADVFDRLQQQGRAVTVLARMKNVTGPWASRAGLSPGVVASLRRALLSVPESLGQSSIKKQGFLPYAAGDLDLVRQAVETNERFFTAAGS